MLNHGERVALEALQRMPKGTFTANMNIDDGGFGGDPVPVQVEVTITDEEFICDFTGSSPQAEGPINCSYTGMMSGIRCIWLAMAEPRYPVNEGVFRPLKAICPPGTVFTAQRPAPTACYWESLLYVFDLIWKAMAPHMPHRLPAGHYNTVGAEITTTFNPPVEISEHKFGLEVHRYNLNTEDPGGEGHFRGGRGVIREYRILHERGGTFTITLGRNKERPWAVDGGREGGNNYVVVRRTDGSVEGPFAKSARMPLHKGDIVSIHTAAGGGWGDPQERPRNEVLADVRAGLMSPEVARDVYGVEL
jgi:N-methylhydantoinase B